MHIGANPLQPPQQLEVVVERQVGVQPVDHVHLGQRLVLPDTQLVPHLFEAQGVGAVIAGLQPRERAEQTVGHADVGRLDADVVVEEGAPGVPLLALAVGQPAEGEQIRAGEQPHPVVELEPGPRLELVGDVEQPRWLRGGSA